MATIKQRVLQTLGEDTTYLDEVPHLDQIYADSIWETASVLPPRLLLTSVVPPVNPEGTGGLPTTGDTVTADDAIVLQIYRVGKVDPAEVPGSYLRRLCQSISKEESIKAKDANSMHYATVESPVWWFENVNLTATIKVFPSAGGTTDESYLPFGDSCTEVYKYNRQYLATTGTPTWAHSTYYSKGDFVILISSYYRCITPHTSTNDTDEDTGSPGTAINSWEHVFLWSALEEFNGIPESAEELIVQRIALRILDHKIANAGTQEEDQEMFTILNGTRELIAKNTLELMTQIRETWEDKV